MKIKKSSAGRRGSIGIKQSKILLRAAALVCVLVFLCACGYSEEEEQRMKEIAELGGENAINYIEEKYEFTPEIDDIKVCKVRDYASDFPPATGYVAVTMHYGEERFRVHINGEMRTTEGKDNFQQRIITEDAKAYFEKLLGYEIYDLYLEYQDKRTSEYSCPEHDEDNLIYEWYETGGFEIMWSQSHWL